MTSTFRVDARAGLLAIADDFLTANGARLTTVLPERPESLATGATAPFAYIDLRGEEIAHTSGTRERLMSPSIVLVDRLSDNAETVARFDATVDLFVDHCTNYPHAVAGTIWDRMTVSDDTDEGMYLVRFAFNNLSIREGRN
jgi:hypothetical protein